MQHRARAAQLVGLMAFEIVFVCGCELPVRRQEKVAAQHGACAAQLIGLVCCVFCCVSLGVVGKHAQHAPNMLGHCLALTAMKSGEHSLSLGAGYGGGRASGISSTSPAVSSTNMSCGRMRSFCTPLGAMTMRPSPAFTEMPPPVPETQPWGRAGRVKGESPSASSTAQRASAAPRRRLRRHWRRGGPSLAWRGPVAVLDTLNLYHPLSGFG